MLLDYARVHAEHIAQVPFKLAGLCAAAPASVARAAAAN